MSDSPTLVSFQKVHEISRGNLQVRKKYLHRFLTLVPERLVALKDAMEKEDRKSVRQVLHHMRPQLEFFGLTQVSSPINQLEETYLTIEFRDLEELVKDISGLTRKALAEVSEAYQKLP